MKDSRVSVFGLLILAAMLSFPAVSASEETAATEVVDTGGSAPIIGLDLARARNQAVRDALQNAVVQVATRFLTPQEAERRSPQLREQIYSQAERFIQDYRLVFESAALEVYTVAVRVTVVTGGLRKELQRLGLIGTDQPAVAAVISLTLRGIRSYGDYARCYGTLKDRIPRIRAVVPREASWGAARFDLAVEETVPTVAERLREKLTGEIRRQDESSLEMDLK